MIYFDLEAFLSIYFILLLLIFFLMWYRCFRVVDVPRHAWDSAQHVRRCAYCGYVFMSYMRIDPVKCQRCGSYLEDFDENEPSE